VNEACDLLQILDTYVYRRAAETLSRTELDGLLELASTLVDSAESGDATPGARPTSAITRS
jgi:DNA-binding GntR family transcriptional regulator